MMSPVQAWKPASRASPLPVPGWVTTLMSGRHCRATAMVSSSERPSTSTTSSTQSGRESKTMGRFRASFLTGMTTLTVGAIARCARRAGSSEQALVGRPGQRFSRHRTSVRCRRLCTTLSGVAPGARRKCPSHCRLTLLSTYPLSDHGGAARSCGPDPTELPTPRRADVRHSINTERAVVCEVERCRHRGDGCQHGGLMPMPVASKRPLHDGRGHCAGERPSANGPGGRRVRSAPSRRSEQNVRTDVGYAVGCGPTPHRRGRCIPMSTSALRRSAAGGLSRCCEIRENSGDGRSQAQGH